MPRPEPIRDEQSRAILDQFYAIDDLSHQISQHLDYLEVLKDNAKHHHTKHDWQRMR